ncbi:peptidase S58 DmpA [Kribbella flavida DSM 17836]|uniref:Peptidase S58 DmpA n=1 Tax=Kribbella flavida (strain DSM 17836 / JCM 10339 / NBRC 14399) TaxID=479435 RepID=D2Q3M1_KRIFD|nr:P1 family peptidase [Kribbella flavida]ADB34144.1 peptidase S58 DmpA [Kribbella flavida DSM 17836]
MQLRARDLGVVPGTLPTGPLNAITDVPGVLVGHTTLDDGADLHTGVTAIVPTPSAGAGTSATAWSPQTALPAAVAVGNGYGKLVGSTQVDELGRLETPILLTGTLSVFRAADALLTYLLDRDSAATSLNPVVGETNDGYLSDIRRRPITEQHVLDALTTASSGLPAEGCVGAGTGTAALGFKAGIGTSSRRVPTRTSGTAPASGTVGALVQSNFSGLLRVLGTPIPAPPSPSEPTGNSCMIVLATDLPLDARQLGRIARRAIFALGLIGSDYAPGSGDYAIAFSTTPSAPEPFLEGNLRPVFQATLDAVEEALLNSLVTARTTTGFRGRTRYAVPHELVAAAGLTARTARA